jgi:tetratricopeptide (TPR) repeat protein
LGKLTDAEALFRKLKEVSPRDAFVPAYLGQTLLLEGRPAEALEQFDLDRSGNQNSRLWHEALVFPALGRQREADAALASLENGVDAAKTMGINIAQVYAYRGNTEKAIEWLEKAYAADPSDLSFHALDGVLLKSVRSDPRYIALAKKTMAP